MQHCRSGAKYVRIAVAVVQRLHSLAIERGSGSETPGTKASLVAWQGARRVNGASQGSCCLFLTDQAGNRIRRRCERVSPVQMQCEVGVAVE